MTDASPEMTRRIRPWVAALLTFVGWGVGLYYARRTRDAWWLAWISVAIGVVLGAGVTALLFFTHPDPSLFPDPNGWTIIDTLSIALSAIVALFVWRAASKQQMVQRGSPARLFGYLAVWLVPTLVALTLALVMRVTALHPFRQPSGSMQPTLQVGEHFLVEKWSYGYSRYSATPLQDLLPPGRIFARNPERGDIAVFRPTPEPDRDFVKRIVGVPGDRIQMIDGVLHLNGEAVRREPAGEVAFVDVDGATVRFPAFRETMPNGVSYLTIDRMASEYDNTREYRVPDGHYFFLGDDRDNSADSRVPSMVGYVPFDNLVGRVRTTPASPR